jgi:Zn finger protein HypA/HybF involved in hydrogenase expression
MITKGVAQETLLLFGIDEPATELKCLGCSQVNSVSDWKQKLIHGLFEFKRYAIICPDCGQEYDPHNVDEIPKYYT